jgi:hypothetical protein
MVCRLDGSIAQGRIARLDESEIGARFRACNAPRGRPAVKRTRNATAHMSNKPGRSRPGSTCGLCRSQPARASQRELRGRFRLVGLFELLRLFASLESGLEFMLGVTAGVVLLPVVLEFPELVVVVPEVALELPLLAAPLLPALPPPPAPAPPPPPPPPPPWASAAALSRSADTSAIGKSLLLDIAISFFAKGVSSLCEKH